MRPPTAEQTKELPRDMLVFVICACPYSPFYGCHPRDIDQQDVETSELLARALQVVALSERDTKNTLSVIEAEISAREQDSTDD